MIRYTLDKFKKFVDIGTELYHGDNHIGWIKVLSCEETTFWAVTLQSEEKIPWNYCDVGKVLFFSEEDYKAYRTRSFPESSYAIYKLNNWNKIIDRIKQENYEFFSEMTYKEKEFYVETSHFHEVEDEIKIKLRDISLSREGADLVTNGNSEAFDPDIQKNRVKEWDEERKWNERRNQPYFAEIVEKGGTPVYIGKREIPGRVVDSRDRHYADILRLKEYQKGKADLIREFDIKWAKLIAFNDIINAFDEEMVSADPFLKKIIEYNRKKQEMVSIAETIRDKQHRVIIRPADENFILEGCAGSGKTLVLLHRLSSLVYNEDILGVDKCIIISPNNLLDKESKKLVEELEIENATKGALNSLYLRWAKEYLSTNRIYEKRAIEKYNSLFNNDMLDGEILSFIYSREFVNEYKALVESISKGRNGNFGDFCFYDVESKRFQEIKKSVYGGDLDKEDTRSISTYYKDMASEYAEICRSISKTNVRDRLKLLKSQIDKLESVPLGANKEQEAEIYMYETTLISCKNDRMEKEKELSSLLLRKYMIPKDEEPFERMIHDEKSIEIDKQIIEIEKKLNDLNKEIKSAERNYNKAVQTYSPGKEFSLYDEYAALNAFYQFGELYGDVIRTSSGEVSVQAPLFKQITNFYKKYHKKTHPYIIELNRTEEAFWHNNYQLIEQEKRFQKFIIDGEVKEYLVDAIETVIYYWKNYLSIDCKQHYEFELYLLLEGMTTILGTLSNDFRLISVDEYQDYAPVEIDLLKRIFGKSVMNLYGDSYQRIGYKTEDIIERDKYEIYHFDENYRNGKEITEYVNDTFSLEMKAIGMESKVNKILSKQLSTIVVDNAKRVVLIVKSEKEYEDIIDITPKPVNLFTGDNCTIEKGKLNVIPVRFVKGMEFETVYVYIKNMTENEQYVAFTRALEALYIIS